MGCVVVVLVEGVVVVSYVNVLMNDFRLCWSLYWLTVGSVVGSLGLSDVGGFDLFGCVVEFVVVVGLFGIGCLSGGFCCCCYVRHDRCRSCRCCLPRYEGCCCCCCCCCCCLQHCNSCWSSVNFEFGLFQGGSWRLIVGC